MRWTTKARIQRVLSAAPFGPQFYYLAQRRLGGFSHFTINSKVDQGSSLLSCLSELPEPPLDWKAVEIGTGWTPILPMLFWLNGQKECDTYDNQRLLKDSLVVETARQFVSFYGQRPHVGTVNDVQFNARLELLEKLVNQRADSSRILGACGIRYHAPVDATATGLAESSVDVVYSNTTLEHAREEEIGPLLRESFRIIKPGGYMLHLIDLSDHFAHSDRQITTINFLRFSEAEFAKYNSRFMYQNRLREPNWRQIIEDLGFHIVCWRTQVDGKSLSELPTVAVDHEFAGFTAEQLCVSSIHVIAQRPEV